MNFKKITLIAFSFIINIAYGSSQNPSHYKQDLQLDIQDANRIFNPQKNDAINTQTGEHRAAHRLMQSFKQEKVYKNLSKDKKNSIKANIYDLDIKNIVSDDPDEAFRLCQKMRPDKTYMLLKAIIKDHSKLHEKILNYISKQTSDTALSLVKYMADLGNISAMEKYKELKQQEEQDEKDLIKAKTYIKQTKYKKAKSILNNLADKENKKAIVELGKIHQEFMYKTLIKQAALQHTNLKANTQHKRSLVNVVFRHKESALKRFKTAGTYGHYYVAKFYKQFAQFFQDTHQALAETASIQANLIKGKKKVQKLLNEGKKNENAVIKIWKNNPSINNLKKAEKLEQQAVAKYKLAADIGDSRGYNRLAALHKKLKGIKSAFYKKNAIGSCKKVNPSDLNYAKALTLSTCLLDEKKLYNECIEQLKKACMHDPKYRKSFNLLANVCDRMFKHTTPDVPTIEGHIDFMIKHGGETAQTHNLLGKCALMKENNAEAIFHFDTSARLGSPGGWYQAGLISLRIKKPKDAKKYLKNACESHACRAKALIELGDIYASEGDDLKARQHYSAAAGLNDSEAHLKRAQCFINGDGGIYNPKLAAQHYEQTVTTDLPFSEQRKKKTLAQLSKLQSPSCEDDTPIAEAKNIQKMIQELIKAPVDNIKEQLKINKNEAKELKAEALAAQANLHLICAKRMQKSIGSINLCTFSEEEANSKISQKKTEIKRLKIYFTKNKNAIASCIACITGLTNQISVATNYKQRIKNLKDALELDPTNARFAYGIAGLLQQYFFPKKKLSEMSKIEKQNCSVAHGLYLRIIGNQAKTKTNNFFLHKSLYNLMKMYRHLFPNDYKASIIEFFSEYFTDKVKQNIHLAHAYETGLLNDNLKPDYKSAAERIADALKLKPKKQYLRKERAFYTYAANPSATLSKVDLAFMLELDKKLNGNSLTSTLGDRLQAYNTVDMGTDDVLSGQGYDKNGKQTYIVNNGTNEQRYTPCSSSSSSSSFQA